MADELIGGGLNPENVLQNASAEVIDANIKACGDFVRKLKSEKAGKDNIKSAVDVLLKLKGIYKSKTGQDWKPGQAPPAAPASVQVQVEEYTGGGLSPEQVNNLENAGAGALDMKIKSCGDLIRKMKTEKASKDDIGKEVKILILLKESYKKVTGQDWKPAAEPKKEAKKEEKKPETPKNDGEKSEKQMKRDAKKAEKQAKKAQNRPEGNQGQNQGQDDDSGPDVSAGKYGNAKMNQSQTKPDYRLIENFAILTEKLDGQLVWVRARLHTSRAKGR